jgi:hypothetical protein
MLKDGSDLREDFRMAASLVHASDPQRSYVAALPTGRRSCVVSTSALWDTGSGVSASGAL